MTNKFPSQKHLQSRTTHNGLSNSGLLFLHNRSFFLNNVGKEGKWSLLEHHPENGLIAVKPVTVLQTKHEFKSLNPHPLTQQRRSSHNLLKEIMKSSQYLSFISELMTLNISSSKIKKNACGKNVEESHIFP